MTALIFFLKEQVQIFINIFNWYNLMLWFFIYTGCMVYYLVMLNYLIVLIRKSNAINYKLQLLIMILLIFYFWLLYYIVPFKIGLIVSSWLGFMHVRLGLIIIAAATVVLSVALRWQSLSLQHSFLIYLGLVLLELLFRIITKPILTLYVYYF